MIILYTVQLKVHLIPKTFYLLNINETTCHSKDFYEKTFYIWLNPGFAFTFLTLCLNCYMTACRESGLRDANDLYPGKKPGQEQNFEIHLPSGPVNFSFHLSPLKYYLPNWRPVSMAIRG